MKIADRSELSSAKPFRIRSVPKLLSFAKYAVVRVSGKSGAGLPHSIMT